MPVKALRWGGRPPVIHTVTIVSMFVVMILLLSGVLVLFSSAATPTPAPVVTDKTNATLPNTTVSVHGTIKMDGVPAKDVVIRFVYTSGGEVNATPDQKGRFRATVDTEKNLRLVLEYKGNAIYTSNIFRYPYDRIEDILNFDIDYRRPVPVTPTPVPSKIVSPKPTIPSTDADITYGPVKVVGNAQSGLIQSGGSSAIEDVTVTPSPEVYHTAPEVDESSVPEGSPGAVYNFIISIGALVVLCVFMFLIVTATRK